MRSAASIRLFLLNPGAVTDTSGASLLNIEALVIQGAVTSLDLSGVHDVATMQWYFFPGGIVKGLASSVEIETHSGLDRDDGA